VHNDQDMGIIMPLFPKNRRNITAKRVKYKVIA